MPEVIAVVALVDPVVLRRMVTIGLEESSRMSVEGMHICYIFYQTYVLIGVPFRRYLHRK